LPKEVKVYSVAPSINVLVAGLSNLLKASAAETELIAIYSKLPPAPPWKLLAKIVPVPGPPVQPAVVLRVIGVIVGVGEGVGLGVVLGLGLGVGLGVVLGLGLGVGLGVVLGLGLGVGLGVVLGLGLGVGLGVVLGLGEGVGVPVTVGLGLGEGVGLGVVLGLGLGVGLGVVLGLGEGVGVPVTVGLGVTVGVGRPGSNTKVVRPSQTPPTSCMYTLTALSGRSTVKPEIS
jgi:hypothetical protein